MSIYHFSSGMEKRTTKSAKGLLKTAQISLLIANFKRLSVEKKALIISHLCIFFFCFFPWVKIIPNEFRQQEYNISIFSQGNVSLFIILTIIFIALLVLFLFADVLLELKKIKVPFSKDYIYLFAGTQQFILIFLALSALFIFGKAYGDVSISFGFFACLAAIIAGMVSTFLEIKNEKKKKAQEFFQTPDANVKKNTTKKGAPVNQIDKD